MSRIESMKKRKKELMARLVKCEAAISGNLTKASIPTGSNNVYWRITWKEKQKTKIQYVRKDEVSDIKRAIKAFATAKKLLQTIGELNRKIMLLQR